MGLTGCIGLIAGVCSQLVISRGWFLKPYFLIGINFTSTIISLKFFNISSITGVLYFNIIVSLIAYLLVFIYGVIKIKQASD